MGGMQALGALFLLYRTHRGSVMQFACADHRRRPRNVLPLVNKSLAILDMYAA